MIDRSAIYISRTDFKLNRGETYMMAGSDLSSGIGIGFLGYYLGRRRGGQDEKQTRAKGAERAVVGPSRVQGDAKGELQGERLSGFAHSLGARKSKHS